MGHRCHRRAGTCPLYLQVLLVVRWLLPVVGVQELPAREADKEPVMNTRRAAAVGRARREAVSKLARRACQRVLTDFNDGSGRPLCEQLAALGYAPQAYISILVFREGTGLADHTGRQPCASASTIAFTTQGSRVVYVCGGRFQELEQFDRSSAANMLIHEMLHSLGLGENPPESLAITAQVERRCGR